MNVNNRAASLVLAAVASIGTIVTVVLAVRATPSAVSAIQDDSRAAHDDDPYAYTPKEAVRSAWKYYIPATIAGVATISCIWALKSVPNYGKMSVPAAYMLLNEAKKKLNAEKDTPPTPEDIPFEVDIPEDQTLFYDTVGERYFQSTLFKVRDAEYRLNWMFAFDGEVEINDLYGLLGIPKLSALTGRGWSVYGGLECSEGLWIEFSHELSVTEDGLQCCIVSPVRAPVIDYL